MPTPRRLKTDSIVEAVFEARFQTSDLPQVVVGKLASGAHWQGFSAPAALPPSQIPMMIRKMDPGMAYLATVERASPDRTQLARFGENSVSLTRAKPYPGWTIFGPELKGLLDYTFDTLAGVQISRLGIRYVNAFTPTAHGISGIADLNPRIVPTSVGALGGVNINYFKDHGADAKAVVKISSRDLIQNPQPPDLSVLVDVDVYTPEGFHCTDRDAAKDWVERAHTLEADEYFGVFTKPMLDRLVETW